MGDGLPPQGAIAFALPDPGRCRWARLGCPVGAVGKLSIGDFLMSNWGSNRHSKIGNRKSSQST